MGLTRVKYVGLSDERIMSKRDLAAAGIGMEKGLKWDRTNRHTLYVDGISEEFLDILKAEGTFLVDAVDDNGVPQERIVRGAPLDDTGNVVHEAPLVAGNDDVESSPSKAVKTKK